MENSKYKYGSKLIEFLKDNKNSMKSILILSHDHPDPDSLGASYAFHYLAERIFHMNARIVYRGIIGRTENRNMVSLLKIPLHKLKKSDFTKYSFVAMIDTQPIFENNPLPVECKATIVIDHHVSSKKYPVDLSIVDSQCAASSIVLAQALLVLGKEIPAKIATALAYGIITDTQNLYRTRNSDIIGTYLDILSRSDMRLLSRIQSPLREKKFFIKLEHCLKHARMYRRLIFVHLGMVSSPDDVSQFADFLMTYKPVKWALCTGRYQGKLFISLRMIKMNTSAAKILRETLKGLGDAGGHDVMAGGCILLTKQADESGWHYKEQQVVGNILKVIKMTTPAKYCYPFAVKGEDNE